MSTGSSQGSSVSTIVAPTPRGVNIYDFRLDIPIPKDANWWRLTLMPNEDGYLYTIKHDDEHTYVSCEFYDDCNTYLDMGMDKPNCFSCCIHGYREVLDVLTVGRPTPGLRWGVLTRPGELIHPTLEKSELIFR